MNFYIRTLKERILCLDWDEVITKIVMGRRFVASSNLVDAGGYNQK